MVVVMRKISLFLLIALLLTVAACSSESEPGRELVLYTSMKESMIELLVEDFTSRHPDIKVEFQIGGAGSLMRQIESERVMGAILADVIWTSEIPDFYYMKDEGLLLQHRPAGAARVSNPLNGADDYFIPARLGTMGIAYNTDLVDAAPLTWYDLLGAEYTNSFAIADPSSSGTALMSVAFLTEAFGEQFFQALRLNGAFIGQGSSQVVDAVASGEIAACLSVDYIAFDKQRSGAPVAMAYPHEMIVIPSPVAIFKDSARLDAAKVFVEYLISPEAQRIIADIGTLPTHDSIPVTDDFNIPTVAEAISRAIVIDYADMMLWTDELVSTFLSIMKD